MSFTTFLAACAMTTAGAKRLETLHKSLGKSDVHSASILESVFEIQQLDFANRYTDDPQGLLTNLNSGLVETDQKWFWGQRPRAEPAANAPIGGTNPTWARLLPTVLAINGSDNIGNVSGVYTFGAPSTAKTPLADDNRADGCFPGYRTFSGDGGVRDPVSWLANQGGFKHARMKAMTLHSGEPPWLLPCSEATSAFPPYDFPNIHQLALHFTEGYLQKVRDNLAHVPSHLDVFASLMRTVYVDHAGAKELAEGVGYRFVAEAANGDDLTRLYQNPQTLDCIISFRGSDNAGDWINNAGLGSRDFCNFVDVHSGFVQKFTNTVTASQFQTNIRANLPKCSSLKATGHSLGGAVAEMFAGCINRAPKGLTPLEDLSRGNGITTDHADWITYVSYKGYIVWFQGTPELMPSIA